MKKKRLFIIFAFLLVVFSGFIWVVSHQTNKSQIQTRADLVSASIQLKDPEGNNLGRLTLSGDRSDSIASVIQKSGVTDDLTYKLGSQSYFVLPGNPNQSGTNLVTNLVRDGIFWSDNPNNPLGNAEYSRNWGAWINQYGNDTTSGAIYLVLSNPSIQVKDSRTGSSYGSINLGPASGIKLNDTLAVALKKVSIQDWNGYTGTKFFYVGSQYLWLDFTSSGSWQYSPPYAYTSGFSDVGNRYNFGQWLISNASSAVKNKTATVNYINQGKVFIPATKNFLYRDVQVRIINSNGDRVPAGWTIPIAGTEDQRMDSVIQQNSGFNENLTYVHNGETYFVLPGIVPDSYGMGNRFVLSHVVADTLLWDDNPNSVTGANSIFGYPWLKMSKWLNNTNGSTQYSSDIASGQMYFLLTRPSISVQDVRNSKGVKFGAYPTSTFGYLRLDADLGITQQEGLGFAIGKSLEANGSGPLVKSNFATYYGTGFVLNGHPLRIQKNDYNEYRNPQGYNYLDQTLNQPVCINNRTDSIMTGRGDAFGEYLQGVQTSETANKYYFNQKTAPLVRMMQGKTYLPATPASDVQVDYYFDHNGNQVVDPGDELLYSDTHITDTPGAAYSLPFNRSFLASKGTFFLVGPASPLTGFYPIVDRITKIRYYAAKVGNLVIDKMDYNHTQTSTPYTVSYSNPQLVNDIVVPSDAPHGWAYFDSNNNQLPAGTHITLDTFSKKTQNTTLTLKEMPKVNFTVKGYYTNNPNNTFPLHTAQYYLGDQITDGDASATWGQKILNDPAGLDDINQQLITAGTIRAGYHLCQPVGNFPIYWNDSQPILSSAIYPNILTTSVVTLLTPPAIGYQASVTLPIVGDAQQVNLKTSASNTKGTPISISNPINKELSTTSDASLTSPGSGNNEFGFKDPDLKKPGYSYVVTGPDHVIYPSLAAALQANPTADHTQNGRNADSSPQDFVITYLEDPQALVVKSNYSVDGTASSPYIINGQTYPLPGVMNRNYTGSPSTHFGTSANNYPGLPEALIAFGTGVTGEAGHHEGDGIFGNSIQWPLDNTEPPNSWKLTLKLTNENSTITYGSWDSVAQMINDVNYKFDQTSNPATFNPSYTSLSDSLIPGTTDNDVQVLSLNYQKSGRTTIRSVPNFDFGTENSPNVTIKLAHAVPMAGSVTAKLNLNYRDDATNTPNNITDYLHTNRTQTPVSRSLIVTDASGDPTTPWTVEAQMDYFRGPDGTVSQSHGPSLTFNKNNVIIKGIDDNILSGNSKYLDSNPPVFNDTVLQAGGPSVSVLNSNSSANQTAIGSWDADFASRDSASIYFPGNALNKSNSASNQNYTTTITWTLITNRP
ncbi:WxL domain-containing protein [Xylocopilactobacillus apicola]|uniref:WxL domain-containing protein n=1 Tax=Xylocopilactobacillus apicola TaxID=2932184 RepID=A0AAU9DMG2_9LACO|nr:WxL domain-containing protein [Xylocopilactobacillus apicola]BDR58137.1 hypothetical protein XA3_05780 [Xylocopilactobacillus apicola]